MRFRHVRQGLRPLAAAGLILVGLGVGGAPASAATVAPASLPCGATLTSNTILAADVGPCVGDGLIVDANNVTIDLNGHRVFAPQTCTTTGTPPVTICKNGGVGDSAGIHLLGTSGVTVSDGTVEGFDAGVFIDGGGGNTVRAMTAKNNVNDNFDDTCDLGDGITALDSSHNTITQNQVLNNGPYSGISIVGNSDANQITGNVAQGNNVRAANPCSFQAIQDEGIRIEGPGADDTVIDHNVVSGSLLAGIGLHGYVCGATPPEPNTAPNQGTMVTDNAVSGTTGGTRLNQSAGINFLQQGPAGVVCPTFNVTVRGNTSTGNRDGIFVARNTSGNVFDANTVNNNANNGIYLTGPNTMTSPTTRLVPGAHDNVLTNNIARGNGPQPPAVPPTTFDAVDENLNPPCDNNAWSGNTFGTVNQPCVNATGYVPLTPFRVLDTRSGTALAPGETRVLHVTGQGGVSASQVKAVALNVTADRPTATGFLTIFPTGEPRPEASNLNFVAGQTVPNAVIAAVGPDGNISIYNASGTTQVIVDIEGFFPEGADYNPLTPVRILDTRSGTPLAPGETRELQVTGSNGIPADAVAVVLNVTAANPTSGGFLTVFPKGDARPDTSNLNFAPGQTIPNLVVATVGTGGKIEIYNATGTTQVLVDVQGWFPFQSEYAGLTPERALDTRSGTALAPGETRVLQITGDFGVPDLIDAKAVVLDVTANQPTATSFLTVFPTGAPRPDASNLNFRPGQSIANTVISKLGDGGKVSIYNASGTTQVLVDVQGFFIRDTGV